MRLTDRRLYQARNLEDFAFRLRWRADDNPRRSAMAIREGAGLAKARQEGSTVIISGGSFVAPDTEKIFGVDTSDWDGNCNYQVFKDFGGKFAVIKAIDGTVPGKYWRANVDRAKAAGLLTTTYAWLYPDAKVSCKAQAQAYWSLIKDAGLTLPPVIDFEWTRYAGETADPNYDDLRKWLTEFIRISGIKPILYSAAGYMNKFGRIPWDIAFDKWEGIWLASYGGSNPIFPMGMSRWELWQFTATGDALALCPGDRNKKELDLNYMQPAFYQRYAGGIVTPPTGETMSQWYRVNYAKINIRDAAGAHPTDQTRTDIGDLWLNDRIEAEGAPVNGWLHIIRVLRAGNAVPVLLDGWCSAQYCVAVVPPVVEPPTTPPAEVKPVELVVTLSDGTKWRSTGFQKVV